MKTEIKYASLTNLKISIFEQGTYVCMYVAVYVIIYIVFTWLNTTVVISHLCKMTVAIIQRRQLLKVQCLTK